MKINVDVVECALMSALKTYSGVRRKIKSQL